MTHNMTNIFWSFINYVCDMPYDMLTHTTAFRAFEMVARSDGSFKLHISVLHDIDASAFYDALPLGTWTDGEWIVFADINRLFYGLHEMYQSQPDSEHKRKMNKAMNIIERISAMNDALEALGDMTVSSEPHTPPNSETPLEYLFSQLHVNASLSP